MLPAKKLQPQPSADTSFATTIVRVIPLSELVSNPNQPRQHWDDEKDDEGKTSLYRLAESIKAEGILQPLVVTPHDGRYLIVCGERRYRAAKLAGLKDAPCVLRPGLTPEQILEIGLIENLQREDLTPVDQAHAIEALMKRCGWSQAAVGKKLGLSVAAVNYKLSLLKLSPELQRDVKKGKLTETQGRAIVQAANKAPEEKRPEVMKEVREKVTKAKEAGEGKVDTKAVATIAKTVVEKVTKPAPASAQGKKDEPAKKPQPVPPPTPKEKAQAGEFAKAVAGVVKAFGQFNAALTEKPQRARFAFVLLTAQPETADKAKGVFDFLGKVLEEVAEQRRQRMVAKLG